MAQSHRLTPEKLPGNVRIDRTQPLRFTFNGTGHTGYAGDTLASALLANGVRVVGRSFKFHRPRGIIGIGVEDPGGYVQLGTGARSTPNRQATMTELYDGLEARSVNCWPSSEFDLMAVNSIVHRLLPAGFYYKTFMWPERFWRFYEHLIRHAAGLGRAPTEPDPDTYDKMNAHCDVLVVGGGPAGLAAALAAGRAGARVILVEQQPDLGGQLLLERMDIGGAPALDWVGSTERALAALPEVRILRRTTAFGYYDRNFVGLLERRTDHLPPDASVQRQRLWRVRTKQVVLATGAIERPLVFPDNDRPGVMLAGAARAYLNRWGVAPGQRVALFTNNDDAYRTAVDFQASGIAVAAIVDLRAEVSGDLPIRAMALGIEVLHGAAVTAVRGTRTISAIEVMELNREGTALTGDPRTIECDLLCVSGGWNPVVHLHAQSGAKARFDGARGILVPGDSVQAERSAGAAKGTFGTAGCIAEGSKAGAEAAGATGFEPRAELTLPAITDPEEAPWRHLWRVPERSGSKRRPQFVDLHNDVTAADIRLAAREGYESVEHAKRYTTLGMGPDQGKTGNIPGMAILAEATGMDPAAIGTTTFRPPYTPVTYGALAGRDIGALADPVRRTPLHHWHERVGAKWEDVGQWLRPWYYPRNGEPMRDAVNRECRAARAAVGILDASTLGKIEIQGPDSVQLLNRVYTNDWETLAVGRCRYGVMLGEDGMVIDDGVTARLGEHHYLMTTTTGNAARVLRWLEEWTQTEWPDLKVYMTSVTEHYATISLCGPAARNLLAEFTADIDLAPKAFPFMAVREGTVGGVPARVFRVSFTGEPSFEINVPASAAMGLWSALMTAGEKYGITPFGTEAMHVLRAEKGYFIVGQETDGTVTPIDLGLDRLVSKRKDFIGKRSLSRSDAARDDRKQLVGLLPSDPEDVLPEGGQVVAEVKPNPPMAMVGHVTSSYYSASLGRSFALALLKGGRARHGETLYVPLLDRTVRVTVTSPVFFDAEGKRLHG